MKKIKFLARVILLVLLLSSALGLLGCSKIPNGYYYPYDASYRLLSDGSKMKICAISNTNVFNKNNVTFDLLIGTHANKYIGRQNLYKCEIDDYPYYGYRELGKYGEYVFALYLSEEYRYGLPVDSNNITEITNYEFIQSISEKDAFSEEYGYVVKDNIIFPPTFYFKHKESITISQEKISNKDGTFILTLACYIVDFDNNSYHIVFSEELYFHYQQIDENTIIINFNGGDKGGDNEA